MRLLIITLLTSLIPFMGEARELFSSTFVAEDTPLEAITPWGIATSDTTHYAPLSLANGQLGMVVGRNFAEIDEIVLGGCFARGNAQGVSTILNGINPLKLLFRENGTEIRPTSWHQAMDLRGAVHTTRIETASATIHCRLRALRNLPFGMMAEIEVEARKDGRLTIENQHVIPSSLQAESTTPKRIWCEDGGRRMICSSASYNAGADHQVAASLFLHDTLAHEDSIGTLTIDLQQGQTSRFAVVGILSSSQHFADPWQEVERQAIYAARMGRDALIAAHEKAWHKLWQGDIEIVGDPTAQFDVRFALYNLYSSIRQGSRQSIPPMGLSRKGYGGHIFWDAEIWMFPTLLVLHPELAREMLNYRTDRLRAAQRRAYAHGHSGAMYPWESDDVGEESTPTFALTGPLEHHITADIMLAIRNYYVVTRDQEWLAKEGYPMMRECAEFWLDRVEQNPDHSYSIRNVVGANEYAIGVDDNAYTNGAVKLALRYTAFLARELGEEVNPLWEKVSQGLRIVRSKDSIHLDHASYRGEMIKQADANLLGYPLGIVTQKEDLLRDLTYYEERIDPKNGPAMSYSIFAVQYARLGMTKRAYELFQRGYCPNLRPPFRVIAETPTSGNPYFMTGAGGMLQAVIFGFTGVDISPHGLVQIPSTLPHSWQRITIRTATGQRFERR